MNKFKQYSYEKNGKGYSNLRQADPRIQKYIHEALGSSKTVLNVGAGTGSYEPKDKYVTAVEPSEVMRRQRPAHLTPAVNATADNLPFENNSFDASMAVLTVHHWPDPFAGLCEVRRVTKGPVVIFTYDPDAVACLWLGDYVPQMVAIDKMRYPTIEFITNALGGNCSIKQIPIPLDCTDGFNEAYYGRPEEFLKAEVRKSQSFWNFLEAGEEEKFVHDLKSDLASGEWDRRYGALRNRKEFEGAIRLITSKP